MRPLTLTRWRCEIDRLVVAWEWPVFRSAFPVDWRVEGWFE